MRLDVGNSIARGDMLFRITDRRTDHSRVDELTHQIEQLADERPATAVRLDNARELIKELTDQTHLFVEARILQLEAHRDELRAEVAAAQARNVEAKASLDRLTMLAIRGWAPKAQLNLAERDGSIADKMEAAMQKRLDAASVELAAGRRGIFIGSNNNSGLRYMQRADQLEQQVGNLAQTLQEQDQRMVRLNRELGKEKARYDSLSVADIVAPVSGSVWEVLSAPQQHIQRGQHLVRVLDCGAAVVTAIVSESAHKRLQMGSSAHFRPHDSKENLAGAVVRISDALPTNLAIQPSAPTRGNYHVTVAVPRLAEDHGCMVGLAGLVSFNERWQDAMQATAPTAP
jgi:multidrug resistance efflux pump